MLLQPARTDNDPFSKVNEIVEPGTMACRPVTPVATKVTPFNCWGNPEAADPEDADMLAADAVADVVPDEPPAPDDVVLLAQADNPATEAAIIAAAAAAAHRVVPIFQVT